MPSQVHPGNPPLPFKMNDSHKRKLLLYFSGALVYGLGILLFRYVPYYHNTLSYATQKTLLYLYIGYLLISPFIYIFFATRYSENKPYIFLRYVSKALIKRQFRIETEERTAVLFLLVKIFFLPTMLNFFFNNFKNILFADINFQWYAFIFTLMFTVDTAVFSFGYAFESKALKNVVKSVEPTFLGWAVAIICYPPFNQWLGNYIPWGANDYALFWTPTLTTIIRVIIVFLLFIYVAATVALGAKASNLTNRGIVGKFPYSVIRHPAYASKVLLWWLTLLPVINLKFAAGMLFWTIIYYLRAITEEKHLLHDPDYGEYCRKVKWKFIPFLY